MPLDKINVLQEATKLTQPLAVATLARVDDFVTMVYICQGAVAWHKHEDQDELFFVQDGEITLETELGRQVLREGEMAVVPRQTAHSSRSSLWSVVLLFTRTTPTISRNGHRKMYLTDDEAPLTKVNVIEEASRLVQPFTPLDLVLVNDFLVRLAMAQGRGPWHRHEEHDELLFALGGGLTLQSEVGDTILGAGEMAVVPRRAEHRLSSRRRLAFLIFASQALDFESGPR
ncbi:MAG: cupin domain-containing protein [Anaerolineae bacterium]